MNYIRKATNEDIPALLVLFAEARATIATLGIDQWQNGYPNREVIEKDISKGQCYVLEQEGSIVATFAMLADIEPTYHTIYDGAWVTGETCLYTPIHRVAIAVSARGRGIATEILNYAERKAKERGHLSLRIDTHRGNVVMRRMLDKNGFCLCGVIYLENGDERLGYEKRI